MRVNCPKRFATFLGLAACCFVVPAAAPAAAQAADEIRLLADTVIDAEALNFKSGPFGTCINGQTFQEQALATCRGHQYAAYFDAAGRLSIARRRLPGDQWQQIHFDDYKIGHNDVHNVAVLGICEADGTIHLSFDHHGSPLHYRVSKPGVAARPDDFAWQADLFGPTTDNLDGRQPLRAVTYPMFISPPDGGLQLFFRIGGSGNGDWHLAEYDPATAGWKLLGAVVSKDGTFRDSTSRCAYPNGLDFDPHGRLHLSWCWRETPDLATNHDLMYARSDDGGRSWDNNVGEPIGQSGQRPMRVDSPGVTVWEIPFRWGMMNQLTQAVDGEGRLHVIVWQNPPDAAGADPDLNAWRYYHYWRDATGRWQRQAIGLFGRKPRLVVSPEGDAVLVFTKGDDREYHGTDRGGRLTVATATAAAGWSDWHVEYASAGDFVGEPRVDLRRWQTERILSVYAQEKPSAPGAPSALRVIEFAPFR
jgi:hypothetical protein